MKINVPAEDKNMHLYLGFLGFNGPQAVCNEIVEWIKATPTDNMSYFECECLKCNKIIANRFIEANKDNLEVMSYINDQLSK